MTPHKANKRGSWRIDKVYRGVGRICLSSGTDDKRVFKRVVQMLDDIARSERADLLKAVKQRRVHPPCGARYHRTNQRRLNERPAARRRPKRLR